MCVGGRGLAQQSQRAEGRALQLLDGRTGVATAFVRVVLASELSCLVLHNNSQSNAWESWCLRVWSSARGFQRLRGSWSRRHADVGESRLPEDKELL